MSFFKQIEGEAAILVSNGVYVQTDIYTRDGYLFARHGSGFVRLMADGSTSKAKLRLEALSWDGELRRDSLGRLGTKDMRGAKALEPARITALLGGPEA